VRGGAGFRELFGGVMEHEAEAARGEDLEQTARISFEEAFHGCQRQLHLMRQEACPICQGAGDASHLPTPCTSCSGSGSLRASRGGMVFSRRCPECAGRGVLTRRPCTRCSGEGRLPAAELLQVALPPGVEGGARIRVPGAGNAGRRGGAPGDLVLVVEVEPHPFYRREGEDLHCTVPISMVEAALGAHVEVPTPDGPVTIEFPAGTQGGQRFRLRKRGLPRLGEKGRGDLWVETQVVVPAVTEDDARRLLEEFAKAAPQQPRRELRR
jgi:molecular chaperone DnaJ